MRRHTGINIFNSELASKRLELLREFVPKAIHIAVLANPADATLTEPQLREVKAAGRAMGLQLQIHNAISSREIDATFGAISREKIDAVLQWPRTH